MGVRYKLMCILPVPCVEGLSVCETRRCFFGRGSSYDLHLLVLLSVCKKQMSLLSGSYQEHLSVNVQQVDVSLAKSLRKTLVSVGVWDMPMCLGFPGSREPSIIIETDVDFAKPTFTENSVSVLRAARFVV